MDYARFETATLGDVDDTYYFGAACKKCQHLSRLSLLKLRDRLGTDFPLRNIRERLTCEQCGARGPILCFLTPAHHGSNRLQFERPVR